MAILAEKYAVDYTWYVDTILNLIRIAGDYVSEEVGITERRITKRRVTIRRITKRRVTKWRITKRRVTNRRVTKQSII